MVFDADRPARSILQNKFYWGVVIPLVRLGLIDVGYEGATLKETHQKLKELFLDHEQVDIETGEITQVNGSTKDLNTGQFNRYIAQIQQFSAEFLSCIIPDPNQSEFL